MSYNPTAIEIVSQTDFRLPLAALPGLREMDCPESSVLDDEPFSIGGRGPMSFEDRDGHRYFNLVSWCGEGSGSTWETFREEVLPATLGSVDLVVTWERGDHFSGLRVRDGVVTEHKVVMTLGEQT